MSTPNDAHPADTGAGTKQGTHTPGPWVAKGNGYQGWTFQGGFLGTIFGADGFEVYAGPASFRALRGRTRKEAEANAHLIAAAPEMLATLKDILGFLRAHGYNTDLVKSVIHKAEGRAARPTE